MDKQKHGLLPLLMPALRKPCDRPATALTLITSCVIEEWYSVVTPHRLRMARRMAAECWPRPRARRSWTPLRRRSCTARWVSPWSSGTCHRTWRSWWTRAGRRTPSTSTSRTWSQCTGSSPIRGTTGKSGASSSFTLAAPAGCGGHVWFKSLRSSSSWWLISPRPTGARSRADTWRSCHRPPSSSASTTRRGPCCFAPCTRCLTGRHRTLSRRSFWWTTSPTCVSNRITPRSVHVACLPGAHRVLALLVGSSPQAPAGGVLYELPQGAHHPGSEAGGSDQGQADGRPLRHGPRPHVPGLALRMRGG